MTTKMRKHLSIKQLESHLQDLNDFESPRIELEQYATPPHIAALMLNTIDFAYDDIKDKFVADLGCGTGRLSVGSLLCGARMVFGFDIDQGALEIGLKNIYDAYCDDDDDENIASKTYRDCERFNFIRADIAADCDRLWSSMSKKFDTVIMNPPFGTKQNQGLDMVFLKRAVNLTDGTVYSLHKTSTRDYILNKCQQWQVKAKPIAQIKYNLDSTYKFHRKRSVDIDVDLWRIECKRSTSPHSAI